MACYLNSLGRYRSSILIFLDHNFSKFLNLFIEKFTLSNEKSCLWKFFSKFDFKEHQPCRISRRKMDYNLLLIFHLLSILNMLVKYSHPQELYLNNWMSSNKETLRRILKIAYIDHERNKEVLSQGSI